MAWVPAMVRIQSLARELPYAVGAAKKGKKKGGVCLVSTDGKIQPTTLNLKFTFY